MRRTKEIHRGTIVPSNNPSVTTTEFVSHLPFWGDLSSAEQKTVKTETEGFHKAIQTMRRSRSEAVLHLMNVREILYAKGHWVKYVQSLAQSARSSYRWMNRATELELPVPVLEAAVARGVDVIHASYLHPFKQLPPPKGLAEVAATDPKVIHYLDRIEALRGSETAATGPRQTPDESEKAAWRAVMREYKRVGARARGPWALRLLARLMHGMSVPAQRLEPEAVPDGFQPKAGYPKGKPRS